MGVIMMLSYSSVTFAMYHGNTTETIYSVSYKRTIAVNLGILISVILNSFLWPVLARRELRKEIALLIGRQGVLFAELVNKFLLEEPDHLLPQSKHGPLPSSKTEPSNGNRNSDQAARDKDVQPLEGSTALTSEQDRLSGTPSSNVSSKESPLLTGSGRKVSRHQYLPLLPSEAGPWIIRPAQQEKEEKQGKRDRQSDRDRNTMDPDQLAFQHVEHQLQTKVIKINELLELSGSEPRLKEEFPTKLYKQIVQCCQNILDRMISMRMAAQLLSPEVRELVTGPMNYYRRDMVSNWYSNGSIKESLSDSATSSILT